MEFNDDAETLHDKAQERADELESRLKDAQEQSRNEISDLQKQLFDVQQELQISKSRAEDLQKQCRTLEEEKKTEEGKFSQDSVIADLRQQLDQQKERTSQVEQDSTIKIDCLGRMIGRYMAAVNGMQYLQLDTEDVIRCENWLKVNEAKIVAMRSEWNRGVNIGPLDRVPRMVFVADIPHIDAYVHAIDFYMAVRSDKPYLGHTQALFNHPIHEAMAAFPWILDAIQHAAMHLSTAKQMRFMQMLTVIQGIGFLNNLARIMQISLDPIRALHHNIRQAWQSILAEGFVIDSIFGSVTSAINGSSLVSWISEPVSDEAAKFRLDRTNSAIGDSRCIIADYTAPNVYVLIDMIANDEVLYIFTNDEVDRIEMDEEFALHLYLGNSLVSNRVGRDYFLSRTPLADHRVTAWIQKFLLHKLLV
ncbi:MAG: hypothetical protein L6R41_004700 [Letrouitia leprolyta]|nr:MAG: hypothetical protein L6R41_004700 [Letrouitia leprolyta]